MNHFNFFEKFQNEKQPIKVGLLCIILAACAILAMSGYYFMSLIKLSNARANLDYLEMVKNDPSFQTQYSQAIQLESDVSNLEKNYIFLYSTDYLTDKASTANDDTVKDVLSHFKDGTKVLSIQISQNNISVEAVAKDMQHMIDVEKSLNASGNYTKVFVAVAKQDGHTEDNGEEALTFTCSMKLAGKAEGN